MTKRKQILTFVIVLAVAITTITVISASSNEFSRLSTGWMKYSHDQCVRQVDAANQYSDAFNREDLIKECQEKMEQCISRLNDIAIANNQNEFSPAECVK